MNIASAHVFPSAADRAQGIQQLQQDIEKSLIQFRQHTAHGRLGSTYWFSNEFPIGRSDQRVQLVESYTRVPARKALSEYRVAIVTGEGGLFQGYPEVAEPSDLILQIDCDPLPLLLAAYFLEELKGLEKYIDKYILLERVLKRFQRENLRVTPRHIEEIRAQFEGYTVNMHNSVFSTPERFEEFKRYQNRPVQQVCLSYFCQEAMEALSEVLRRHGAVVHFFNPSNVCEYPMYFYQANPYRGEVINIEPSRYMQMLPFSDDAVCVYSQLFGSDFFTRTCPHTEIGERLHANAMNRLERELTLIAKTYTAPRDARTMEIWETNNATLQQGTKVFLFIAEHPELDSNEWMLRLTAARLEPAAIEELKKYQHTIKAIARDNQVKVSGDSTSVPLTETILDKVIADSSPHQLLMTAAGMAATS